MVLGGYSAPLSSVAHLLPKDEDQPAAHRHFPVAQSVDGGDGDDGRLYRHAHGGGRPGRHPLLLLGLHRISADLDGYGTPLRQAGRPVRAQARASRRDRRLPRRLDGQRACREHRGAHRHPGAAGARGRRDAAHHADDRGRHLQPRGALADAGRLRGGVGRGGPDRASPRRHHRQVPVLALGVLHQRSCGDRRRGAAGGGAPRERRAPAAFARLDRSGPSDARPERSALRGPRRTRELHRAAARRLLPGALLLRRAQGAGAGASARSIPAARDRGVDGGGRAGRRGDDRHGHLRAAVRPGRSRRLAHRGRQRDHPDGDRVADLERDQREGAAPRRFPRAGAVGPGHLRGRGGGACFSASSGRELACAAGAERIVRRRARPRQHGAAHRRADQRGMAAARRRDGEHHVRAHHRRDARGRCARRHLGSRSRGQHLLSAPARRRSHSGSRRHGPAGRHEHPAAGSLTCAMVPAPRAREADMATKYLLREDQIPRHWYNILADLKTPPAPVLHPGSKKPVTPEDLAPLFPRAIIEQEMSSRREIAIPDEVRAALALWRPSPLYRAHNLERAIRTRSHVYYKYEGVSPAGSHKPNTAVAQAWYNAQEGVKRLATETGAGQWGSALAFAGALFGLKITVYMVRISYEQKPYRRSMMRTWGAEVVASPTDRTNAGRSILAKDSSSNGSLGIAISEAVEDAATHDGTKYSLGSVLNHVGMHQTVIGLEAQEQMKLAGEYPDVVIACHGGGSNFSGIALPFARDKLNGKKVRLLAAEPTSCPTLTKGVYAFDYGDTVGMTPIVKMHTLGHDFMPPGIHAGGLRD